MKNRFPNILSGVLKRNALVPDWEDPQAEAGTAQAIPSPDRKLYDSPGQWPNH
jgi:hypothetical protein